MYELFLTYLELLWPPRLIGFFRSWREPCKGQGLGPALYSLFLPIFFICAILALATDIAIVAGVVALIHYLIQGHVTIGIH